MPDEPGALWIPTTHCWPGDNHPRYVIVHGTGSSLTETAQHVAQFFQSNVPATSTHYVIGRDGTVVQCVAEADAAWGNGVISAGADSWWAGNPNEYTCSIEHVNDSANGSPLTPEQQAASFALIAHICERHAIPMRPADAAGGITGHYSIDPVNRAHCPGNYPWAALWAALGVPMPTIGSGMQAYQAAHPEIGQPLMNETYRGNGDAFCVFSAGTVLEWQKAAQQVVVGGDVLVAYLADEQVSASATLAALDASQQQVLSLQAQLAAATVDPAVKARADAFEAIKAALATA